jgi:hypothetical protein
MEFILLRSRNITQSWVIRGTSCNCSAYNQISEVDIQAVVPNESEAFEIKPASQHLHSSQCHHLHTG